MRNEQAWLAPAEATHPIVAVSQVMDVAAPEATSDRISLLARLISQRGYTAAELAYAARELPFDDYLNDKLRYGKSIMPADFERVIERVRTKRRLIGQKIPGPKLDELLLDLPDLSREDFAQCGFDGKGRPLFVMKSGRSRADELAEKERRAYQELYGPRQTATEVPPHQDAQ